VGPPRELTLDDAFVEKMCTHCVGDGLVEGAVAGGAGAQGLRRRTQAGGARANADGISPRPTRADVHVLQHPEGSTTARQPPPASRKEFLLLNHRPCGCGKI
jgi:hypothetical protein